MFPVRAAEAPLIGVFLMHPADKVTPFSLEAESQGCE